MRNVSTPPARIPGSFFRREGRPGQEAILACRLTDRSIRPLISKAVHNDVQIILTVLSADPEHPAEILGMVGTSAASGNLPNTLCGSDWVLPGGLQGRPVHH